MSNKDLYIRSSSAEFLIFEQQKKEKGIEVRFEDGDLWLTQKALGELYNTSKQDISYHIKNIYNDLELNQDSTVKEFLTVQKEGNREVKRKTTYYNLDAVISVGYRVSTDRAIQFRRWATNVLKEFSKKGYIIDKKRMENGTFFDEDYYEELLAEIREIRLSERRFYQKITDIYATSIDYDRKSPTTIKFFKKVQNKMHYAAHQHTAAEVVYDRVDNEKPMLGMTNFKGNYITKDDVTIAKNYLTEIELQRLNLLVSQFFDYAELQAMEQHPMTMQEWIDELDRVLSNNRRPLLEGSGSISHQQAQEKAVHEYTIYRQREMNQLESDYDRAIRQLSLFSGSTEQLSGETSIDEE